MDACEGGQQRVSGGRRTDLAADLCSGLQFEACGATGRRVEAQPEPVAGLGDANVEGGIDGSGDACGDAAIEAESGGAAQDVERDLADPVKVEAKGDFTAELKLPPAGMGLPAPSAGAMI